MTNFSVGDKLRVVSVCGPDDEGLGDPQHFMDVGTLVTARKICRDGVYLVESNDSPDYVQYINPKRVELII